MDDFNNRLSRIENSPIEHNHTNTPINSFNDELRF